MNVIAINVKSLDGSIKGTLDVFETDINIIYQMTDIKDPEKRKSNYVREFTLPGTKNNNIIFNGISENGYSVHNYNPNHKLTAQVILNDNIFFEGNLQLNEIIKLDNNKIEYKITIYGSLADFFNEFSTQPMSVLDISEYNHQLTMPNIYSSWANTMYYRTDDWSPRTATGYIWKYGQKSPFRLGDGYVYPLQYMGQTDLDTEIDINSWQPAVYVKTLFDKIFSKYGYRYRSSFLNSEYFRKLILPYASDNLTISDTIVKQNEFKANVRSTRTVLKEVWSNIAQTYPTTKIIFGNDSAAPAVDEGNVFNTTSSTYKVGKNGQYKMSTYLQLGVTLTGVKKDNNIQTAFLLVGGDFTGNVYIKNASGATVASKPFNIVIVPQFSVNGGKGFYAGASLTTVVNLEFPSYLTKDDEYHVEVDFTVPTSSYAAKTIDYGGTAFASRMDFYVYGVTDTDSSSFTSTFTDKTISEDDWIDMNKCIPDMSILDFITSLNKMFNLYWQPTGNDKEFIIEPRDKIYSNTVAKDWTDKVNNGKVVSIKPLYDITGNKYKFSYQLDNDYYNDEYNKAYAETYGTKVVSVDNDFVTEVVDIQNKFCSTPTVDILLKGIYAPSFVSQTGTTWKPANIKQRILFYGGLISIPNSNYNNYIKLQDNFNKNGGPTKWKYYPYAGHFDNPTNPTQDLNYGVAKKYYWNWVGITNNNLFNKFWSNSVLESIDANSHLLTAEVLLSDLDMTNFDLTWIIQVDNVHYRINKVTYNPLTSLAEVELFKAKNIITPLAKTLSSGSGNTWTPNPWIGSTPKYFSGGLGYKMLQSDIAVPFKVSNNPTLLPTYEFTNVPQFNYGLDFESRSGLSNTWSDNIPAQTNVSGVKSTNSYNLMAQQDVVGKRNIIAPTSINAKIIGDNNNIMENTKNITIQGNNNKVMAGVSNVSIVGDNQVVTESNVSIIQGVKLRSGGIVKNSSMITSTITSKGLISGGFNNSRSINKEGYRGIISGGIDSV